MSRAGSSEREEKEGHDPAMRDRHIAPHDPITGVSALQKSEVIGGWAEGLGGVEREAEVAFGVAPGIVAFAGILM